MSKIKKKRGLVIALDVDDVSKAVKIACELKSAKGNFIIKVGRPLEIQLGGKVISLVKNTSILPLIYDGKIADIPYISKKISKNAYQLGADAVIVHAFVGSDVLKEIINLNMGDVIAVIDMTHSGSREFIEPVALKLAKMAVDVGVDGVVLPATKPRIVKEISKIVKDCYIISPGVITQGAKIGDAIKSGADYEIVGRAIYNADNPREVAEELYRTITEV
jgi:orotidine-5'-phosphate decarboxylase